MTSDNDEYAATASAFDSGEHLPDPNRATRLNVASDDRQPKSALAVRLSGTDIRRLRVIAEQAGEGPTQVARRFILEGIARAEAGAASPELVASVARALDRRRGEIAEVVAAEIAGQLDRSA